MKLKGYRQKRPPHIFRDQAIYFITARTRDLFYFFRPQKYKKIFKLVLKEAVAKFQAKLYGWVINHNHYHLLISFDKGTKLAKFIRFLHGKTARLLNDLDNSFGQKIFQNYWETIIRNEKDFYTYLSYIHQNPIKHGIIQGLNQLANYEFCSYRDYLKAKEKEWLNDCWERYPVIDFIRGDECLG